MGITKTHDLVARTFLWSGLNADVEDYVHQCDACRRHKVNTRMYAGKLQPLSLFLEGGGKVCQWILL